MANLNKEIIIRFQNSKEPIAPFFELQGVIRIDLRIGLVIGRNLDVRKMRERLYAHENEAEATSKVVLNFMELDPAIFLDQQISSTEEVLIKDVTLLEEDLLQITDFVWCEVLGGIEKHGHPTVVIDDIEYEGMLIHALDNHMYLFLREISGGTEAAQLLAKIKNVPKELQWLKIAKEDGEDSARPIYSGADAELDSGIKSIQHRMT
ncbi:hypothetical protein [Brevibacillus agri]|uniref:hypothetical protein n=1 Tax=Brevibacillus agri TaxID=51101 RepID=UPI003D73C6C7